MTKESIALTMLALTILLSAVFVWCAHKGWMRPLFGLVLMMFLVFVASMILTIRTGQ